MKWFKIGDDRFLPKEMSIQFNIDTANNNYGYAKMVQEVNRSVDITISMDYNEENKDYFFNLFDKAREPDCFAYEYRFDINSSDFFAHNCVIRSLHTDPVSKSIVMNIRSYHSIIKPIEERREETIDQILNQTYKK